MCNKTQMLQNNRRPHISFFEISDGFEKSLCV